MKKIELSKQGLQKFKKGGKDFYSKDVENLARSYTPGEWVIVVDFTAKIISLGAVNLNVAAGHIPILRLIPFPLSFAINSLSLHSIETMDESILALQCTLEHIDFACSRREILNKYNEGGRLIYGENDCLPGLIVDRYVNCILLQIQTAAFDRFRHEIKDFFQKKFPQLKIILNDHLKNRQKESLPIFENNQWADGLQEIQIRENHLTLQVLFTNIQKNGYYFDHRENRLSLYYLLKNIKIKLKSGLDLFSYNGSWGLHQLSAGVEHVLFVDQGDFSASIDKNLDLNGGLQWQERGQFIRGDCFEIINLLVGKGEKFDVVTCDPPAMAKSEDKRKNALHGYTKLIGKLLELLAPQSILAFGSCTRYVSWQELEEVLQRKLRESGRKFSLLQMGIQGSDHPIQGTDERGSYIKYFCYFIES